MKYSKESTTDPQSISNHPKPKPPIHPWVFNKMVSHLRGSKSKIVRLISSRYFIASVKLRNALKRANNDKKFHG